jgi:hypothetical protein
MHRIFPIAFINNNMSHMLSKSARLNVYALRSLIRKLTERYTSAIRNDRPLKDAKEIKKAIHYVEKKIAEAEEIQKS